ncbi:alpha/beta hydrolase [Micromonospora globispora]|uniref:Alpha/beta hydrolase n=2 Tax=Micromonospora globispora TaxID=1450148 RepID=A0A317K6Q4_9ACTN|nr:alpha/beta hydrolase [Micromonospora globispora]
MVVVPAAAWGVAAARWTPRGPLTNAEALWAIGISAAVGLAAGWMSRSRWSMLTAPAAFVVALEVTRMGVRGPSVDAPQLSPFGIIALVGGRGVHGVLSVLPLVLGAAYGGGLRRRTRRGAVPGGPAFRHRRWPSVVRRAGTGLLTVALAAVTVAVAIPARTAPLGPRGVAELTQVDVGGYRLGVMIRGVDTAAPVLLFIPGSPGGTEIGTVRRYLGALERRFVVATLDRRGGGSSYPALDPTATVTLDSQVTDTLAVTDYLRRRFGQEKIYLLGHSGGSIVSVLAVQRHPEKYRAYIGTGQAVDLVTIDRIAYHDILAWARSTGRDALARQLLDQGPPPYRSVYRYEPIMMYAPQAYDYDHTPNARGATGFTIGVAEYTLLQRVHTMNAILDTWSALYPDMQHVDLRRDVPRLAVPVYFVQGGHEMRSLAEPFRDWYQRLDAPQKHQYVFETAGHRAMFEQPDRFAEVMDGILAG